MERLKSITIIFLLAIGLLASAAPAKSASVLLQEGLYAEEIEGDLNAAIKIYEQVIAEAKKVQRTAAHATYRIGMCYLKKGQKDKAAEYFQNIISDFAGQKALVAKAEKQLDKIKPRAERIVEQAVMTISTCAEGDPRVTKALESLKGLDENVVVSELVKFLDSETDTVRRSAIHILWKGNLSDISPAVPALKQLCSHKEDITRGMTAIVLGAAKIKSSFDVLCNMTLKDPSGYARRCAAYALGLMGRADARPTLEKAFKDSDPLVQHNAKAALTMLEPPAVGGFGPAERVPVEQLIKSGKVPAFKTQIYDNTGLDLETGVTVPFMDEWPALCDVAWDNDGGGALMIKPRSSVRFLALGAAEKWEDAISMARNSLDVLRTSTSKGMFASQSKFAAVLTCEGNLAVIQIGEYDANKGTIYGWVEKIPAGVESFGPVIGRIIYTDETGKDCHFDLDTGKAFSFPKGLTRYSDPEKGIPWLLENGIDFLNCAGRLQLWDMVAVEVEEKMWDSAGAVEIDSALMRGSSKEFLPTWRVEYTITTPRTYAFETREGGIGLLQILEKRSTYLRIRYKMLQQKLADIETLIKEMYHPEAQRFAALNKLIKIGAPAVEPLISELQKSNNWQVPKALGAIGDKQAVEPLIKKWQKCDWSPMKEVISEALERITGKKLGQDKQKWDKWWQETKRFISPEATIQNFMAAAMKLDIDNAMACVAGDSHDYEDIKAIFEKPEHPFNMLFRKIDPSVPVKIIETKIIDNMCEAVWQVTFKEDFTIEGKTFKAGETFDIDGNLHKYGDKWLITGI